MTAPQFSNRCLIVFFLFVCCVTVNARWVRTEGPKDADVASLFTSTHTVFAGTVQGGVFQLTDVSVA